MKAVIIVRGDNNGNVRKFVQAALTESADIAALTGAGLPPRILVAAPAGAVVGQVIKAEIAVTDHSPASPAVSKGSTLPDGTAAAADIPARDAVCWGIVVPA